MSERFDPEASRPSPSKQLSSKARLGWGSLYSGLAIFWGVAAAVPGGILMRVACGLASIAFAYSAWRAFVRGEQLPDDDANA